ncbi:MAG: DNA recombination protein RmuC [Candidatus Nanopelagicales bacterium]|jgi:DNA recombination protein RmuC|nr:DNA recombination protein RmuC [Candidatus Nanopelagicales bacterium]
MQTTVWVWTGLVAVLVLVAVAGWLLRGLVEGRRLAAERAVATERVARLAAELEQAREAAAARAEAPAQVAAAMAPVQTALDRLEAAVARAAGGQAGAVAQLAEQLRAVSEHASTSSEGLRRETARLVGALGHSEVRGRWGEFQLRRLLETSGLVRDVHFTEQVTVATDEGRLRPDVVLHLGVDKTVVVDAKVSLRAILAVEAGDPEHEQAAARAAHAREVRAHVERLASKEYARQFDTAPEFVVMFLPAESLLAEALAWDASLLEDAFTRNVVLASPTTFMALTRTVAHIWRQDALAENARELQALGRELTERLGVMVGHLDRLGASLGASVTAYNRTIASMETRVLVTGRRFAGLQGLPEPESPRQVEVTPRAIGGGRAQEPQGEASVIDMAARGPEVVDVGA